TMQLCTQTRQAAQHKLKGIPRATCCRHLFGQLHDRVRQEDSLTHAKNRTATRAPFGITVRKYERTRWAQVRDHGEFPGRRDARKGDARKGSGTFSAWKVLSSREPGVRGK